MKIRFISVNDFIDSFLKPGESASITVAFKSLINDSYCRDLSLKIRSVLTAKRKRGEFIGSNPAYGYLRDPDDKTRLIIDEQVAYVVRNVFDWYISGMSKTAIAMKLNELGVFTPAKYRISKYPPKKKHNKEYANNLFGYWTMRAVHQMLENPVYCGHVCQNKRSTVSYKVAKQIEHDKSDWIIVKNTHEPIVSEKTFELAQELLKRRYRKPKVLEKVYPLSGYLRCWDCKRTMGRNNNLKPSGKSYPYYRCSTNTRVSPTACTKHYIRAEELEKAVLSAIQTQVKNFINLEERLNALDKHTIKKASIDGINKQMTTLKAKLEEAERFKIGLYTDLKREMITEDEYIVLKNEYAKQIEDIKKSLRALAEEQVELVNNEEAKNKWIERFKKYGEIDFLSRELVVSLIDVVYVHENKEVEVVFGFADEYKKLCEYLESMAV